MSNNSNSKKRIRLLSAVFLTALFFATTLTAAQASSPVHKTEPRTPYLQRAEVQTFIAGMVNTNQFSRDELETLFASARYNAGVIRLMTPAIAPTGTIVKNWRVYRSRFIEPIRINAGVKFWQEHADVLEKAAQEFGVPEEIIVGIIGVETIYGRITGDFRVIDTLTTLAFDYPKTSTRDRSAFFREQLEDYLLFARSDGVDPLRVRGSFAGAVGIAQFMPGSIRRFGIDYDHDGHIDLLGSPEDAIGSVANFLVQHGWQRDRPTHYPVSLDADSSAEAIQALIDSGSEPSLSADDLREAGLDLSYDLEPDQRFALIDLPNQSRDGTVYPTEYVLGTQNFHVITRYNRSYFYAMSVIELGEAVKDRIKAIAPTLSSDRANHKSGTAHSDALN